MKIYLAGKIARYDWRHRIVDGLSYAQAATAEFSGHDVENLVLHKEWPFLEGAIFNEHDYTGPFFIGQQPSHVVFHGRDTHGVGLGNPSPWAGVWAPDEYEKSPPSDDIDTADLTQARRHTVRLCLNAILRSDVVFAWMDSSTAYGTLVELGFALAHRKPIWWAQRAENIDMDDLWFIRVAAREVIQGDDPATLLRTLLDKHAPKPTGYVYLLKSGDHYKIGKSKNVDQRVTQISPRTPLPVELLHSIGSNDMSWLEAQLHSKYAQYRTNGEWFALPSDAVEWITSQTYVRRPR